MQELRFSLAPIYVTMCFCACAGSLTYDPIPGFEPSLSEVTEAHKLSKYAASALSFEDIPTAIKHLTDALKLLTQPNQLKASRYPPTR